MFLPLAGVFLRSLAHRLPYTEAVNRLRNTFAKILVVLVLPCVGIAKDAPPVPTLRWTPDSATCTFREGDDGRTYYGVTSGNYEITLAVDRQELEKIPHRSHPMLGVFLTFQYKGQDQFEVQQNRFTLEFTKHFQVVQSSLDPDYLLKTLQENVDDLTDEVERHQVKKHPDQKDKLEAELQTRLKDYTEMMDFISTRSLQPMTLDGSNSSASGWVFFSIKNKFIGPWRRPEQFVLRLPVENVIVEFPFSLPPEPGKVILRKRPDGQSN